MKQTRKQKVAFQQRGASMRAMDQQARRFNAAVESGELVITHHLCAGGCGHPVASPGLCGECACEDDGAIW